MDKPIEFCWIFSRHYDQAMGIEQIGSYAFFKGVFDGNHFACITDFIRILVEWKVPGPI